MYENPWTHNGEIIDENIPEGSISFVYRITNLSNDKKYIGKKILNFRRTKKIKGKKRKIRTYKDSDWRNYYGSSTDLNEDRTALGNNAFKREILRFCKSKGEASYWEAKYIFETDAVVNDMYYNQSIMVRVHRNHIKM